jgi:ABC-type Fe3+ transport system permease subunit
MEENVNQSEKRKELPYGQLILVLGIASIPLNCICIIFPFGAVGLYLAYLSLREFEKNPDPGAWSNYQNVMTGKICSMISFGISLLVLLVYIFFYWEIKKYTNS